MQAIRHDFQPINRITTPLAGTPSYINSGIIKAVMKNGDKVRIKVRFRRARELSHMNLCEDLMAKFLETVAEYGATEKPAKLEGKNYMAVVIPKAQGNTKKAKKEADNS